MMDMEVLMEAPCQVHMLVAPRMQHLQGFGPALDYLSQGSQGFHR
jgi:hypothetical protein